MRKWLILLIGLFAAHASLDAAAADQALVQMAQQELTTLGYDPGAADGEMTTQTVIAISKFQAEKGMDVTGEVSPQLIGALRAASKQPSQPATAQAPAAASPPAGAAPPADLQARQQACLQEKYEAAQQANKRKQGFGRLLSAASRVTRRFGGPGASETISDVYNANATADDLSAAAKDLGLSEDEIEQCRNPT